MTKSKKIRKIWVIHDLIDNPQTQKDIKELWKKRGEVQYNMHDKLLKEGKNEFINLNYSYKPKKYADGWIGISKSAVSKIFNGDYNAKEYGLLEEGIVEKTIINNKTGYRLVNHPKGIYKILDELKNASLPLSLKKRIKNKLMKSDYVNNLITKDLIKKLKLQNAKPLTLKEINFIYIVIRNSPDALFIILNKLYGKWRELFKEDEKVKLLTDLQFYFFNDVHKKSLTDKVASFYEPVKVRFNLETTLTIGKDTIKYNTRLNQSPMELLNDKDKIIERKKIEEQFGDFEKEGEKIIKKMKEKIGNIPFDIVASPLTYE